MTREAHAIEEAARARLYNHFMQAPFPIGVLRGAEHALELANPIALHAWGKDSSIVGKPIIEGIPELRGQPFVGYLDEVVRTGVTPEGNHLGGRMPTWELDAQDAAALAQYLGQL